MDLICAMHELGRCGQVTGTVEQLCRICRCTSAEMSASLVELRDTKTANISERGGRFTVTNRRMYADFQDREAARLRKQKQRKPEDVTTCPKNVTSLQDKKKEQDKRVSQQGHSNVTPYSSSSSSISYSDKRERESNSSPARAPSRGVASAVQHAEKQLEIHRQYYPDFSGSFSTVQIGMLSEMTDLAACDSAFRYAAGNGIKPTSIERIKNEVYANREWERANGKASPESVDDFIRNYGK